MLNRLPLVAYPAFFALFLLAPAALSAQKKTLDYEAIHHWHKIEQSSISPNGQWVAYQLVPHTEGDAQVVLWSAAGEESRSFDRSTQPTFTADSRYLVFLVKPPLDSLKAQRRRKVKDEDLPKDTLAIYHLSDGIIEKFPAVKSFSVPEEWSGLIACQLEPEKPAKEKKEKTEAPQDSTQTVREKKKIKKEGKDNGSKLLLIAVDAGARDTFGYVTEYSFAQKMPGLVLASTGTENTKAPALPGVYYFAPAQRQLKPLFRGKGKYQYLSLSEDATRAAFLSDTDTTKARIRPWQLCLWFGDPADSAHVIANPQSQFLPNDAGQSWIISENARPEFSENGKMLYFGIAPPPVLPDTTLLPEEIVKVEVWTWQDERIYPEQKKRMEQDKKRSYPVVYHLLEEEFVPLGGPELPNWRFLPERNAPIALAYTESPYLLARQWEGEARKDVYVVDLTNGLQMPVVTNLRGNPSLSPAAKYVSWWSDPDSAWHAWNLASNATVRLTNNEIFPFYNEEQDVPDYPSPYGIAGWLREDAALLLYDRCDIWRVDPTGAAPPRRLTRGRENNTVYRYIRLDPEERSIAPDARILLHQYNEGTKAEGYAWFELGTDKLTNWYKGDFAFTKQVKKAKKADAVIFTCENFQTYPDLLYSNFNPANRTENPVFRRISNANPQQSEYRWGTIERVSWISLNGEVLEGLLVKPEGFDSTQLYPMIVNYYERSSDGLHQHRAPDAHRSTINFTIYASRGYLIFVPDIHYKTGYPGESAYNAVMSGVNYLVNRGFVDPERIGLQGHSWGGYQTVYLVTRTDMFACAEAGAAVVNMTSAYGGIRWESGLSRQFQYEHQQSRIGGSLWEYPMRYLENSPLFSLDKVNTPMLILQNDEDGAVPWYQGIELFSALRRLSKPSWMLNYTGEPHWPVKLQNRIDFQTRMLQFFDHYLMDGPLPPWMEHGVPPLEMGIRQGLH